MKKRKNKKQSTFKTIAGTTTFILGVEALALGSYFIIPQVKDYVDENILKIEAPQGQPASPTILGNFEQETNVVYWAHTLGDYTALNVEVVLLGASGQTIATHTVPIQNGTYDLSAYSSEILLALNAGRFTVLLKVVNELILLETWQTTIQKVDSQEQVFLNVHLEHDGAYRAAFETNALGVERYEVKIGSSTFEVDSNGYFETPSEIGFYSLVFKALDANGVVLISAAPIHLVVVENVVREDVLVTIHEGNQTNSYLIAYGSVFEEPAQPIRPGYNFIGWEGYDFQSPITENITIFAIWEEQEPIPATIEDLLSESIVPGTWVEVTATVTGLIPGINNQVFLSDTNFTMSFGLPAELFEKIQKGDQIKIVGAKDTYFNMVQIRQVKEVEVLSSGNEVVYQEIESFEGVAHFTAIKLTATVVNTQFGNRPKFQLSNGIEFYLRIYTTSTFELGQTYEIEGIFYDQPYGSYDAPTVYLTY